MNFDLSPLWISLKTAGLATIVTFFVGIIAARWMLGYRGKARGLLDGLLIAPLVLPPTVVGFLLLLLLGRNGPIGQRLYEMGVTVVFTWQAAAIAATVVAFPLMYRTALGAMEQIDPTLLACARTLGASEWVVFWQILLPLSYRGIIAATILAFARALGEFGATLMLAGNIPGQTQTMPIAIFFATESGDMGQASLWVAILLCLSLSVIMAVNFWSDSRRATSKAREPAANHKAQNNNVEIVPFIPPAPSPKKPSAAIAGLQIDIQKNLPSFSLEVSLSACHEAMGLLGASGSGKSMTLRCIAGLETPNRGHIRLNNRILFDSNQKVDLPSCQRRIGVVFQNYALFPHLTVRQNIAFGLRQKPKIERDRTTDAQIAQMQLQGLENRYPHQLSGGQQQRVALARALAIEPEALLLDEPFSALDTQLRSQMEKQLIETLASYPGTTLLVTHNLEEVYRVCQNLLAIAGGKVLAKGDKRAIFARPSSYEVAKLTGCKNFSQAEAVANGVIEAKDWNCRLQVIEPIPANLAYVGIRAHHVIFEEIERIQANLNQSHVNREEKLPCPLLPLRSRQDIALETIPCQSPQLQTIEELKQGNTFLCWLAQASETPFRMTLYLKLHSPPTKPNDFHLQVELFKENWQLLKDLPFPWRIRIDALRLFMMGAAEGEIP